MNRYKLVIFDLDGTIADTSPGIFNSIRYVQRKMNLPEITDEQMRSHVGPPMEESYNRNFGLTGDLLNRAIKYHKEYAIEQGYKELIIYDGIIELLNTFKNKGIKIAAATLKAHSTAVKIFKNLNIYEKFDMIIGADPVNPMSKSQMLNFCADALRISKTNIVLIGDSKYDAIGAEEAGIDYVAVTYGFGFKFKSDIAYPHVGVVNTPYEIADLII